MKYIVFMYNVYKAIVMQKITTLWIFCASLLILIWYVTKPTIPLHPALVHIKERISFLNPKYGDIPLREGKSSYTENKSTIYICLRDPKSRKYYDINTLMYVSLHELAHVISHQYGHGDEFKENFDKLLNYAETRGIYDRHIPMPKTYCGVEA